MLFAGRTPFTRRELCHLHRRPPPSCMPFCPPAQHYSSLPHRLPIFFHSPCPACVPVCATCVSRPCLSLPPLCLSRVHFLPIPPLTLSPPAPLPPSRPPWSRLRLCPLRISRGNRQGHPAVPRGKDAARGEAPPRTWAPLHVSVHY